MASYKFGYVQDGADPRDNLFAGQYDSTKHLPDRIDFRGNLPPCYNQGLLDACVANAVAIPFFMAKAIEPSRLFIHYNGRSVLEPQAFVADKGCRIRDAIKMLAKFGAPIDVTWPYKENMVQVQPSPAVYREAERYKGLKYWRIVTLNDMLQCLAAGSPFVAGLALTAEFKSIRVENTGVVNTPLPSDPIVGGHAVTVVGYDKAAKRFICRNSWGSYWGQDGYFTIPFDYLSNTKFCLDMWTLR
jgi:C1A family cysteine protease